MEAGRRCLTQSSKKRRDQSVRAYFLTVPSEDLSSGLVWLKITEEVRNPWMVRQIRKCSMDSLITASSM
jgi:hypothetical protein